MAKKSKKSVAEEKLQHWTNPKNDDRRLTEEMANRMGFCRDADTGLLTINYASMTQDYLEFLMMPWHGGDDIGDLDDYFDLQ